MDNEIIKKGEALRTYFAALKKLQEVKILLNKKDFTCQVGEWLVESTYNGKRATNSIQKGWDVDVNGKKIQVKAHAKSRTNNNRWSLVDKSDVPFDELIIVVFSPNYKLKEFYKLPWDDAWNRIQLRNKKTPRHELNWSDISEFKVDINELPGQEIIELFRESVEQK